jgi:hypothetical protein
MWERLKSLSVVAFVFFLSSPPGTMDEEYERGEVSLNCTSVGRPLPLLPSCLYSPTKIV